VFDSAELTCLPPDPDPDPDPDADANADANDVVEHLIVTYNKIIEDLDLIARSATPILAI
jgi:hypothetical protein